MEPLRYRRIAVIIADVMFPGSFNPFEKHHDAGFLGKYKAVE